MGSYLGHFDENRGFTNQDIEGLESCFQYMNSWSDYALYRQGRNGRGNAPAVFGILVVLIVIIVMSSGGEEEKETTVEETKVVTAQPQVQAQPMMQPVAQPPAYYPAPQPYPQQQQVQQPVFNITIKNDNENKN